jgi:hypothetical protein
VFVVGVGQRRDLHDRVLRDIKAREVPGGVEATGGKLCELHKVCGPRQRAHQAVHFFGNVRVQVARVGLEQRVWPQRAKAAVTGDAAAQANHGADGALELFAGQRIEDVHSVVRGAGLVVLEGERLEHQAHLVFAGAFVGNTPFGKTRVEAHGHELETAEPWCRGRAAGLQGARGAKGTLVDGVAQERTAAPSRGWREVSGVEARAGFGQREQDGHIVDLRELRAKLWCCRLRLRRVVGLVFGRGRAPRHGAEGHTAGQKDNGTEPAHGYITPAR